MENRDSAAPDEKSVRDLRRDLADVLNDAAVHGKITYVMNRGRRIAAVVPVPVADDAVRAQPRKD